MPTAFSSSTPVLGTEAPSADAHEGKVVVRDPLLPDELRRRLALTSPGLVKELYETAQRQIATETGRQTRLDSKATSLLTGAGLALTVAFTFGGQIVLGQKHDLHGVVIPSWGLDAFGVALVAGLGAAAFAVIALFVRGSYVAIDENAVFDPAVLKDAEDAYHPAEPGSDDAALTEYRKALIPHLWEISQTHRRLHDTKGIVIKFGQICFTGFILAIMVVCFALLSTII